jgi:hypothetical protein
MSVAGTVALPRPGREGHADRVPLRRVLQVRVCVLALIARLRAMRRSASAGPDNGHRCRDSVTGRCAAGGQSRHS